MPFEFEAHLLARLTFFVFFLFSSVETRGETDSLFSSSVPSSLTNSSRTMGADCCGGGPPPPPAAAADVDGAAAAVDGLSVAAAANQPSPSKAQKKADAAAAAANARPHSEYVADLQAFLAKRIELFEQYRKRDVDKVMI